MKSRCAAVLLATIWTFLGVLSVSVGQELLLKPLGDAHAKALNESILFTCEVSNAEDDTDYKIKWVDNDGREITDRTGSRRYVEEDNNSSRKLYITRIATTDAGQYTCSATIGDQTFQKSTKLQIFQQITFGNVPAVQYLQFNTTALIRCDVTGEPKPEVSWRYAGKRLTFGASNTSRYELKSEGLSIKSVVMADSGNYTCRAEVDADGRYDERKISVEVHIPPKISEGPGTIEGVEGRQATLECKVSDESLPKPKYEFFKDDSDQSLKSTDTLKVDAENGRVHFESLTKSDAGKYTCTAANDVGKDSASGSLRVLVKPSIYELNNATENEEKSAVLTCKSHGDPLPTMTFSKQGNEPYQAGVSADGKVTVSDGGNGELTLTINNLTPEDSGNYVCRSNSSLGSDEKTTNVLVQYQPQFAADHPRVIHGWAASSHNITCRASGQPSPQIEWLLRDEVLVNNETFHVYDAGSTSHLLVKIKPADQAWVYNNYTCRASNNLGRRNLLIELKRATVPGQPAAVDVTRRTPTMLVLSVTTPEENGGVELTGYRVEYKEILVNEFAIGGKVSLENLEPNTTYTLVVRAKNDVGAGPGLNVTATTEPIRQPSQLTISSAVQSKSADRYLITWEHPDTGGKPITDYEFKIRPVKVSTVNGSQLVEPLTNEWKTYNRADDAKKPMVEFELRELKEMTSYEIEIKSKNDVGWSPTSEQFIFTTSQEKAVEIPSSVAVPSTISVGLVLAITIVVLILILVAVDLSCYFANNCGLTSLICVKVCGRTAPLSKEKTAEEGESKEALTENQSPVKEPLDDGQTADADATAEKIQTEATDAVVDENDEKPLLIDDNSDVKKDETTDEIKPDDADDEPVKKKIDDDEEEEVAATDDKKEVEEKQEEPATAEDGAVTATETAQPAEG